MFSACHQGHTEVVTVLLAAGAAVDVTDNKSTTLLCVRTADHAADRMVLKLSKY